MLKLFLALLFFFLLTSLWGFYQSIRPPKIISSYTPKDFGFKYEDVWFETADGLTLKGWFITNSDLQAKTIVLLHGYPADKGDILPAMAFLAKKYNIFLFDFRYLGQSEGSYSTAGAKETEDLKTALRFLEKRGIHEVGVWGFSLGGAVALMVAPEAPQIKTIVSEASYAELGLLAKELYRIPILKHPLGFLTQFWAKLFLGIDPQEISPQKAAPELKIPVLLIHSTDDEVIPFSHALLLKEALHENLRAEFWFAPNLRHGELSEEYQKRIENFFAQNL